MKASDLSYDVKQKFLNQIRNQVGSAEYGRMINTLGEDGLIDLALEQANEASKNQTGAKKKKGFWGKYGWLLLLASILITLRFHPATKPWTLEIWKVIVFLFILYSVIFPIQWLFSKFSDWLKESTRPPFSR